MRINLEQVRARNAMMAIQAGENLGGVQNGDAVSGFPALIINNGILATLSFCISKKDKGGYKQIGNAIARHLADEAVRLVDSKTQDILKLRDQLVEVDSSQLRLCTAETLAFLNYLKRFAKGETKRKENEGE